jgi:hypothetical protein
VKTADLFQEHGISAAAFYAWKAVELSIIFLDRTATSNCAKRS